MISSAVIWDQRLNLAAHPLAYPLLRGLARCGRVARLPGLGIVVNDATIARDILRDDTTFTGADERWTPILGPSVLFNMRGAAHRSLRRKLTGLFTPAYTDRLCARILADPIANLSARLNQGAVVDLVDTIRVMASAVVCEVVGLEGGSEADFRHFYEECERVLSIVGTGIRPPSPASIALARRVVQPIGDIAAKAYRRGDEGTVMGRMRALGLSEDEARGAAGAFFVAGVVTTPTRFPRLIALLHDSGQLDRVAADPTLLDPAIDEAMRFAGAMVLLRRAQTSSRVAGVTVKPGDRIIVALINCFLAEGPYDLDRPHPPELHSLWFGAGPHFCIGYPLAMAETRAVARAVLAAAPVRIVDRKVRRGALLPSYSSLRIARDPCK